MYNTNFGFYEMTLVMWFVPRDCFVSDCEVIPWCMSVMSGVQIEFNLVVLF